MKEGSEHYYQIDERISHLTDEQINELMKRYYDGESATKLVKEYNLKITSSQLYKVFPPIIHEDIICPNCGIPMITKRVSKSSYFSSSECICPRCNHNLNKYCYCETCKKEREELARKEEKRKRGLIRETYSIGNYIPRSLDSLRFKEKVYLGALLRVGLSEDYSKIFPLANHERSFAPNKDYEIDILRTLVNNNIIMVYPDSPIDAFTDNDEFPNRLFLDKVCYHVNVEMGANKVNTINLIMNPKDTISTNHEEAFELWREIALEECKEYLLHNMKKVGFEFSIGEKTIAVLNDLLDKFSVSQVYGIIYSSTAYALRYYHESKIPRKQAANSVITNCQNFGERALVNNWNVKKYGRNFDCPQSVLSEFFFNRVIGIGDEGFNGVPF